MKGKGVMTYTDGTKLSCYWGHDTKGNDACNEGKGKIYFPNGDEYKGDIKNGVAKGNGVLTHTDGSIYTGGFRKGKKFG